MKKRETISGLVTDEERALYGRRGLFLTDCAFRGAADGESALKECRDIAAERCLFDLRYPLWHDRGVSLSDCEMTERCRAPLWYSRGVALSQVRLHGTKALRECRRVTLSDCDVASDEFGWRTVGLSMTDCQAAGAYFVFESRRLRIRGLRLTGKYSFQYAKDAELDGCILDTKDALWHSESVVVRDSVLRGEYLGWYAKNLTLIRCKIIGTQPLCYCRGLRLIDCEMEGADLAFERSAVRARLLSHVDSIKNPRRGSITLPSVGEVIRDGKSKAKIYIKDKK